MRRRKRRWNAWPNKNRTVAPKRAFNIEHLEHRHLLAANVLTTLDSSFSGNSDRASQFELDVELGGAPAVLALRVTPMEESVDPAAATIKLDGIDIPLMSVSNNVADTHDSVVLAEFQSDGRYVVSVGEETDGVGSFRLDVLLPGDITGDGRIDDQELLHASAAFVLNELGGNHVAEQLFRDAGIDVSSDLYNEDLDANLDGSIDLVDLRLIQINQSIGNLVVGLAGDMEAPTITVSLDNDTGRFDDDGLTNDENVSIVGTVFDEFGAVGLEAAIDDDTDGAFVDLMGPDFLAGQDFSANPNFALTLAQLESIAGTDAASLLNDGAHTLFLRATDEFGNRSDPPVEFVFEIDTLAPDAPSTPLLLDGNGSDAVNDSTPTFSVDVDDESLVQLFSSLVNDAIGESADGGSVEITADELPDGVHFISATATDLAGNESSASSELNVIVDTGSPTLDSFGLLPVSNQTDADGNPVTDESIVTLSGTTEAGATVQFLRGDDSLGTSTAGQDGQFSLGNVALDFGQSLLTIRITDAADNLSTFDRTITRDAAPEVIQPIADREVDEDSAPIVIDLNDVFDDADLVDGDTLTFSVDIENAALVSHEIDNGQLTLTLAENENGSSNITVTATDEFSQAAAESFTLTVNVTNDPPVVTVPDSVSISAGTDQSVLGVSVTDVEGGGGRLFASFQADDGLLSLGRVGDVLYNFGDGTLDPAVTIVGSVDDLNESLKTLRFLPNDGFTGETEIRMIVDDNNGTGAADDDQQVRRTIVVNVVTDPPPIANLDEFRTDEDSSVNGNVLVDNGNGADSDGDGDELTIANSGTFATERGASVTLNADGSFSYDAGPSNALQGLFTGESEVDTFLYQLTDGVTTTTGLVEITVTGSNDSPVVQEDQFDVDEDTVLAANLFEDNGTGIDFDPEGREIQISDIGNISSDEFGVIVDLAANGDFTYDPRGISGIQELAEGETAQDRFSYRVSDGTLISTGTSIIVIAGVNDAPVAENDRLTTSATNLLDGNLFADNGNGADSDIDQGSTLSISNARTFTSDLGATVTIADDGSISYDPTASDVLISLLAGESLEDTFTYELTDGQLLDVGTVVVVVSGGSPQAPAALGETFQVITGSTGNVLDILANDSASPGGGALRITNAESSRDGTVTIADDGQSIEYAPASGFIGTERISYTVTDDRGEASAATATVQTIHDAPDLESEGQISLSIFVNGEQVTDIPADIGVNESGVISFVHTEEIDGRIQFGPSATGAPTESITVGDFFETWRANAGDAGNNPNAVFNDNQILDNVVDGSHVIRMWVNGVPNEEFENYVVRDEDNIVISYEPITDANTPTFVPIGEVTVLGGAPIHIPLDGFDLDSVDLTFRATSANESLVETFIPEDNRSMRISVGGFGEMMLELFDGRVPRVTERITEIANGVEVPDDFGEPQLLDYDGVIFHRVIEDFMIQGGDPTGTGSGDPRLGTFDDQLHVDLQHTSDGILSMAKTADDDSGSSQFFITAGPTRHLDFNHSVFGRLIEGDHVRRLIAKTPVDGSTPIEDVVMEDVEIVVDSENAVLMLKAPEGASGTTDVTVTVADVDGNQFSRTFTVNVEPDEIDGGPILLDIPELRTTVNQPLTFTVSAIDLEGSEVSFDAARRGTTEFEFEVNQDTGDDFTAEVTVTPPDGFTGELRLIVGAFPVTPSDTGAGREPDSQVVSIFVDPAGSALRAAMTDEVAQLSGETLTSDADVEAVVRKALDVWEYRLGESIDLVVEAAVEDLPADELGEAVIVDFGDNQVPSQGRVTFDVDANGFGWHVDPDTSPDDDTYDLFTVALHEVGHLLGFSNAYVGFARHVVGDFGSGYVFVAPGTITLLDGTGEHLDEMAHPADLMNAHLELGERRLPSSIDVAMLQAARRTEANPRAASFDDRSDQFVTDGIRPEQRRQRLKSLIAQNRTDDASDTPTAISLARRLYQLNKDADSSPLRRWWRSHSEALRHFGL